MKKRRFALVAATALVAFGMMASGCGDSSADSDKQQAAPKETGNEVVINVTASNWKWELDKTEVKVGQPVKLVVTSVEGLHGLTIDGTTVKDVKAMKGQPAETVIFTPEKAGDLMLRCTIMCGTGHAQMKTVLKVVE